MGKPTEQEMETALAEASRLRESGEDAHHLGKALLNSHYQSRFLMDVLHAAQDYLHSGMAEREHTLLIRAIEKAREVDDHSSHRGHEITGL